MTFPGGWPIEIFHHWLRKLLRYDVTCSAFITDFTNLCGLVKFYGTAHGCGVKPIIGADFY
ncbi:hypothetical protein O9992_04460 [Vibrio lentus]|nr:hypothetical protein [Vibrio lentus]